MIFLVVIIAGLAIYWCFMAFMGMIVLWRSSWATRKIRAAARVRNAKRRL